MLSFILTGNVVNKKFAYYKITKELDIFDNETFMKSGKELYVTATNIESGDCEYFKIDDVLKDMEKLRATSAIPIMTRPVLIDGKRYLDGGVSDLIPVKKCLELGCDKVIVVLTQPDGYVKRKISEKKVKTVKFIFKKYPKLVERMLNRHNDYNECIKYIDELEKEGKVFVIRPSEKLDIDLIERNPDKLESIYQIGIKDMKKKIKNLKKYLK